MPFTGRQKKSKNNCEDTKQFTMYTGQTAKTPEQIIFVEKAGDNHKFDLKRFMEECVMSEIIVVTSGKGGVGKTTVTANLEQGCSCSADESF